MKSELSKFIIFVAGAIIGSFVTWKITKDKYEKIANDEIESVKESFSRKTKNEKEETKETVEEMVESLGYSSESKEEKKVNKPYLIDQDDLGETGYEIVSLVYYADGVLADDWDNVVEDVDDYVGKEPLERFEQYGDDLICVRNDEMKVDFEIVADVGAYEDVVNPSSHFMEDE